VSPPSTSSGTGSPAGFPLTIVCIVAVLAFSTLHLIGNVFDALSTSGGTSNRQRVGFKSTLQVRISPHISQAGLKGQVITTGVISGKFF
jgi:hypothetical protein